MSEFKEFDLKSLRFYSDIDYFSKNNIRYHDIFHYPVSKFINIEIILINKYYGKKDWELKAFLIVDFSRDLPDNVDTYLNYQIIEKIDKSENEIHILRKIDIDALVFHGFIDSYDASLWYKGDLVNYKNFVIYNNNQSPFEFDSYFYVEKFFVYSESQDEPQKIFDISENPPINAYFEICAYTDIYDYGFVDFELFFVLRDSSGEKIWESCELISVCGDDTESVDLDISGYINYEKESEYTLEALFMGNILKKISFKLSDYNEIQSSDEDSSHYEINPKTNKTEYESIFTPLDNLVGLEHIKSEIKKIGDYVQYLSVKDKIVKEDIKKLKLHLLFIGNPGTSKTKIALMLGNIFKKLGVLSKGIVNVVNRNHLIGSYIGETAIKTSKAIENARGGILFIDEAYSIFKEDSPKDYGLEAIEILIKEMSDGPGDLIVIAAGYPKDMEIFLKSNQGLISRFKYIFRFPDFTVDELIEIAKKKASMKGLLISNSAIKYIKEKITEVYNSKDETFGNARYISDLITKAEINLASRTFHENKGNSVNKISLKLEKEDFISFFNNNEQNEFKNTINEDLFRETLKEINSLVGIEEVKNEILELAQVLKYYREEEINYTKKISLHSIFLGNPGTGKTTVARIIAKVYKSLGILEKGHLVECDRAGLVGAYIGHTAIKTEQMIQRAMGGILFIDEAYSLFKGENKDFGNEAIEILLKRMEDYRAKFAVICAGYTDEMNQFLFSNPGLKSRFDKIFHFRDYSVSELYEIALNMLNENSLNASKVTGKLLLLIESIYKNRDRYFGNAREIRGIVEKIVRRHDLRLSQIEKDKRTISLKSELTSEDLDIIIESKNKSKPQIGFRIFEN